jgi:tetratricopeptide (TPR) repeat protein
LAARDEAVAALIAAGLEAEQRHDPLVALGYFRQADAAQPDDPEILQKIAKQLSDAAFLEENDSRQRELAEEALGYARRSTELAPDSAVNRLSLSVIYGKLAGHGDVRTRIGYARRIRQYAEEALALDPGYAWARHVLGRWHLEMVALGSTRRAVVSLFFGGLPPASLDEAVRLLEEAVALEPEALAHHVELGFAYARTGRKSEASESWRRALEMPSVKIYDETAKERAREALHGRKKQ